jgi:hypothetical protein
MNGTLRKSLPRLRFDRHEFAGALGDLGTDLPLIVLLILTCGLDVRSVLVLFGICQVLAGLAYRLPIPVQPLKLVATIAIAEHLAPDVIAAGGLAIGAIMLVLSLSGGLELIARAVPRLVVRGLQFGLGIKLAMLALQEYLQADGMEGYALGAAAFVTVLLLRGSKRHPAALWVVAIGALYAIVFHGGLAGFRPDLSLPLATLKVPGGEALLNGLLLLAIPQLPLSVANAVIATRQTAGDLFPGVSVSARKLGLTYSLANLIVPFFGGVPVCHGSGGLAGHYAFGARTGGSVIIYGTGYLLCGLVFGGNFMGFLSVFPKAVLGVLLLFEGVQLMLLSRDSAEGSEGFFLVLVTAAIAAALPYGFAVATVVGVVMHALFRSRALAAGRHEPQLIHGAGVKTEAHCNEKGKDQNDA